jgi:hypothetical protein
MVPCKLPVPVPGVLNLVCPVILGGLKFAEDDTDNTPKSIIELSVILYVLVAS